MSDNLTKVVLFNYDFNFNRIFHAKVNHVSTQERMDMIPFLKLDDKGMIVYDTDEDFRYKWAGNSWVPSSSTVIDKYEHLQSIPSATWEIAHNLHFYPKVTILDSANDEVLGDIHHVDRNNIILSFSAPFSGTASLS